MIAKVYFSYIELDESDNEKFLTSEEELSPDSYGHWIDPNNQEYEAFLPISPEANNQFQSALPQVFKSASYSNERATSYNPFKQFISHEDLPIENSMLCIQSILSREMSVFILPKTAQPQCLGKHVLGFDIKVDDTESNLTSEAVLHFREYYSHKIYQESENESESPQNLNIKSTIQRIIKDSKNLPVIHKFTLQLFDLLPREAHVKLEEKKLQSIENIIQRYTDKIAQLQPNANERKSLFERIAEELYVLNNEIYQLRKQRLGWRELIENARNISEEEIFFYTYAVFHHAGFKKKFSADLKRNWPRVPLFKDFFRWVGYGERLFNLHTNNFEYRNELESLFEETENDLLKFKLRLGEEQQLLFITKELSIPLPSSVWSYKIGDFYAAAWLLQLLKAETKEVALPLNDIIEIVKKVISLCQQTMDIKKELSHLPI